MIGRQILKELHDRLSFMANVGLDYLTIDRRAATLSGGEAQRIRLATQIGSRLMGVLYILDEPTTGVDAVSRREFWEILGEMKREGMTILISTAYLDEGEKCDQLAIMHKSHVLGIATPEAVRSSYPSLEEAMIHRIQEVDERLIHDRFGL